MSYSFLRICFLSFLFIGNSARAIDVGNISSFIKSNTDAVVKEVKNPTETGRLISVKVERISSPLDSGVVIPMESRDEILLTPASLILPGKTSEQFRFYYHGPKDGIERYYRIYWLNQPLGLQEQENSARQAQITTSAKIGTILVVTPRKVHFDYQLADGKIKNTGNSSFKVTAYGGCRDKKEQVQKEDDCVESFYLLPGNHRGFSKVDVIRKGHISLWFEDKYVVAQ